MFLQNGESFKSFVRVTKFEGFRFVVAPIFAAYVHFVSCFFLEPFLERLFGDFFEFFDPKMRFWRPLAAQGGRAKSTFAATFSAKNPVLKFTANDLGRSRADLSAIWCRKLSKNLFLSCRVQFLVDFACIFDNFG